MGRPDDRGDFTDLDHLIADVILGLQPGDVVTYGEVAAEAGRPGASRAVGRFLGRHDGFPWWRVVNAKGRLVPGHEVRQTDLLASEGVSVANGYVVFVNDRD